jgi:RHS repeat-associated protein
VAPLKGLRTFPAPESASRYEYDGLNLLRVDERCDSDADGIIEAGETTWRMVELNTHHTGQLGAQIGKRVYHYASGSCTPSSYDDYSYAYDAVGNLVMVFDDGGDEAFHFAQDAFGNEVLPSAFGATAWDESRDAGVMEHQTGKTLDPFTGLYFFHARWFDSVVGRFVGRSPLPVFQEPAYEYAMNSPAVAFDPDGAVPVDVHDAAQVTCILGCVTKYYHNVAKQNACIRDICQVDVFDWPEWINNACKSHVGGRPFWNRLPKGGGGKVSGRVAHYAGKFWKCGGRYLKIFGPVAWLTWFITPENAPVPSSHDCPASFTPGWQDRKTTR